MYSVLLFIENGRFQVLPVPSSWIEDNSVLWPDEPAEVAERFRTTGEKYWGKTRKIPVIVTGVAPNLAAAETAAMEFARHDYCPKHYSATVHELLQERRPMAQFHTDSYSNSAQNNSDVPAQGSVLQEQQAKAETSNPLSQAGQYGSGTSGISLSANTTAPAIPHMEASSNRNDNGLPDFHIQNVEADGKVTLNYGSLKADLKSFIHEAVNQAFAENLAKLTSLSRPSQRATVPNPERYDDPIANHQKIDSEADLEQWNLMLDSDEFCDKYVQYFSKIIPPGSYEGRGDSAMYTIVDCLFTRAFWNNFTWTGVNRGNKSNRGFREFGNVLSLLQRIVCVGDASYTMEKLESFCRVRLFRYSKTRCMSKGLRKSSCRPNRGSSSGAGSQELADKRARMDAEDEWAGEDSYIVGGDVEGNVSIKEEYDDYD